MKRGRRNVIIIASLAIGLIVLGIFLEYITLPPSAPSLAPEEVFLSPINVPIPQDCSDESIIAVWETFFNEPSTGIEINTTSLEEGKCNAFSAFKINGDELFLLTGIDFWFIMDMKMYMGLNGKFTDEYLNIVRGVINGTYNETSEEYEKFLMS